MEKRSEPKKLATSHLFTVRIWCELVGEGQKEWRGQVEQVMSGEIHYFRDWPTLVSFLKEALEALEPDNASK